MVVTDISTTVLKITVPSLIKRFYIKATALLQRGSVQSVTEDCCEGDVQSGQQQEVVDSSKELLIKNQWDFDAVDTCIILRTVNISCMVLYLPQLYWGLTIFIHLYFHDHSNPFNFHQIHAEKLISLQFSLLTSVPSLFLCLKILPLYSNLRISPPESKCSNVLLSFIDCVPKNLQPSVTGK